MDIKDVIPPVVAAEAATTLDPDQLALTAIELICGDDFCEDQSCLNMTREDGDLKTAIDKLTTIYVLSHAYVKSHTCYHVHDSWRKRAGEIVAAAKEPEAKEPEANA